VKRILLALVLLLPTFATAQENIIVINRTEVRYGKLFANEAITFTEGQFTRSQASFGLRVRVSDKVNYKSFYLLQNDLKNSWSPEHILGATFDFRF